MAGVFLMFIKGKEHRSGLYLVPGGDGRGFERTVQAGFGDLVVLADVDALDAAQTRRQPFRVAEQTIFVEKIAVVDTWGDLFFESVVMDRELPVLAMLPVGIGRPRRFASDHEDHATAAPVRENDPFFKEEEIPNPCSGGMVHFPRPNGTSWADIKIQFRDEHTVTIWAGNENGKFNLSQMGMASKKNGGRTEQWKFLDGNFSALTRTPSNGSKLKIPTAVGSVSSQKELTNIEYFPPPNPH